MMQMMTFMIMINYVMLMMTLPNKSWLLFALKLQTVKSRFEAARLSFLDDDDDDDEILFG